jgi:hypothetical protein
VRVFIREGYLLDRDMLIRGGCVLERGCLLERGAY